jgi:predicted PurR-regulated permease PerM
MFDTIPSLYWMIIIGVPVIFFTFILYQLGMLFKESREIVKKSTGILTQLEETLTKANKVLADAEEIVTETKATFYEVNRAIIKPVRTISSLFNSVNSFVSGISRKN